MEASMRQLSALFSGFCAHRVFSGRARKPGSEAPPPWAERRISAHTAPTFCAFCAFCAPPANFLRFLRFLRSARQTSALFSGFCAHRVFSGRAQKPGSEASPPWAERRISAHTAPTFCAFCAFCAPPANFLRSFSGSAHTAYFLAEPENRARRTHPHGLSAEFLRTLRQLSA
jgi:hypothetical protein